MNSLISRCYKIDEPRSFYRYLGARLTKSQKVEFWAGSENKTRSENFFVGDRILLQKHHFLLDIKFSSLKIARDSDENCGFHLRKCAKIFFSKNNLSNVLVVATFIRLTPNFRRRSSDNIEKFDIL